MLYEFGFQFHLLDLAKVLFFVIPLVIWFFANSLDKKLFKILLSLLSFLFAAFILLEVFIFPVISYFKIKQDLKEGFVYTVEGEVKNFSSPESSFGGHNSESFSINDVDFIYFGTENYGYSRFACNHGVITGNGQNLKITYVKSRFDDELVICKIESANKTENEKTAQSEDSSVF